VQEIWQSAGARPEYAPHVIRRRIRVDGIVQGVGVGFRPFVANLAASLGLAGFVQNDPRGACIEIEGAAHVVTAFGERLVRDAPPAAVLESVVPLVIPPRGETAFRIAASERTGERDIAIAPDLATCDGCLREILDPRDRRHRHAFACCTAAGRASRSCATYPTTAPPPR
jgi:hydrogenase maturation protein HypF